MKNKSITEKGHIFNRDDMSYEKEIDNAIAVCDEILWDYDEHPDKVKLYTNNDILYARYQFETTNIIKNYERITLYISYEVSNNTIDVNGINLVDDLYNPKDYELSEHQYLDPYINGFRKQAAIIINVETPLFFTPTEKIKSVIKHELSHIWDAIIYNKIVTDKNNNIVNNNDILLKNEQANGYFEELINVIKYPNISTDILFDILNKNNKVDNDYIYIFACCIYYLDISEYYAFRFNIEHESIKYIGMVKRDTTLSTQQLIQKLKDIDQLDTFFIYRILYKFLNVKILKFEETIRYYNKNSSIKQLLNNYIHNVYKTNDMSVLFNIWKKNCQKFINHAYDIHYHNLEVQFPDIFVGDKLQQKWDLKKKELNEKQGTLTSLFDNDSEIQKFYEEIEETFDKEYNGKDFYFNTVLKYKGKIYNIGIQYLAEVEDKVQDNTLAYCERDVITLYILPDNPKFKSIFLHELQHFISNRNINQKHSMVTTYGKGIPNPMLSKIIDYVRKTYYYCDVHEMNAYKEQVQDLSYKCLLKYGVISSKHRQEIINTYTLSQDELNELYNVINNGKPEEMLHYCFLYLWSIVKEYHQLRNDSSIHTFFQKSFYNKVAVKNLFNEYWDDDLQTHTFNLLNGLTPDIQKRILTLIYKRLEFLREKAVSMFNKVIDITIMQYNDAKENE